MLQKPRIDKRNIIEIHLKLPKIVFYSALILISLLAGVLFHLLLYPSIEKMLFPQTQAQKNQSLIPKDIKEAAERIVKTCTANRKGEFCYAEQLGLVTQYKSLNTALQVLSAVQTLDPSARGCHLIAHSISHVETKKNLAKWEDVLSRLPESACTGGFIHGVIEAKQLDDKNFVVNNQTIIGICDVVNDRTDGAGDYQNCSHIMGHLLMVEKMGDIPQAVTECNSLPENMQYECNSGVYMENETRDNLIVHGIAKRIPWNKKTTNDQKELCKNAAGIAQTACWREITHMFVFVSRDYPPAVYSSCSEAPTKEARDECYQHSIGIMSVNAGFDLSRMGLLCKPYEKDSDAFRRCFGIAIGSMMASSPQFADRVIRLCKTLPSEYTEECYTLLGDKLTILVPKDQREIFCKDVPSFYKRYCLGV